MLNLEGGKNYGERKKIKKILEVVHLFERDHSIQRRYQKVIEVEAKDLLIELG